MLIMHHPVHAEKCAKDTRLYLGLIGAWKGTMRVGDFPSALLGLTPTLTHSREVCEPEARP